MASDHDERWWPIVERDPPVPVVVDLSHLFATPMGARPSVTMGARAYGIRGSDEAPGHLIRWVRTSENCWLGVVRMKLRSSNGHASVAVEQLVPAADISRPDDSG